MYPELTIPTVFRCLSGARKDVFSRGILQPAPPLGHASCEELLLHV